MKIYSENNSENKFFSVFDRINAEEQLKQKTYNYLQDKIRRKKGLYFNNFYLKKVVAFASVIFIIITGGILSSLYFTGTAFIDIDVNPSIELSLNRFNYVIGAYAYNKDGEDVLNNANIKNKPYDEAIKILINKMSEMDYIQNSSMLTATLQINNDSSESEMLNTLRNYINRALELNEKEVQQDVFEIDYTVKESSHGHGMTPAKYLAILELQETNPEITFESCHNSTIGEIKEKAHTNSSGESSENNSNNNHNHNHKNH